MIIVLNVFGTKTKTVAVNSDNILFFNEITHCGIVGTEIILTGDVRIKVSDSFSSIVDMLK